MLTFIGCYPWKEKAKRNEFSTMLLGYRKKRNLCLILALILVGSNLFAQSGALDDSFIQGSGANSIIQTSAIQQDGKIIIGGSFTAYNEIKSNRLARLNADGSLDATFKIGIGADSDVKAILVQSDGKIIVGGWFNSFNGTKCKNIARLNIDGSIDQSFDSGSGADYTVENIAIQSDGKIIIGGGFSTYNGIKRKNIARLNSNGSLDTSFDPEMGANNDVYSISIQSDGKILIAGSFTFYNETKRNNIARLNVDGSLDESFNPKIATNIASEIRSIALQPNGKIIIAGNFTCYNGTSRNHIARLNADGGLDSTFDSGTGATGINSSIRATALQPDGKIFIGGWFDYYDDVARNYIARLNSDGSLDTSFNPGSGANSFVMSILAQSNEKVIVTGGFTSFNESSRNRIAVLE